MTATMIPSPEYLGVLRRWVPRGHLLALRRVVFGDATGVTVFLVAFLFFGLGWRVSFFINDTYTVANLLLSVVDGRLHIGEFVYGPPGGGTPGAVLVDGTVYGRYYGLTFVALPFLWVLSASALVVDPAYSLPLLWSVLLVALGVDVGERLGRRRAGALCTGAVAAALLATNVVVAQPLRPELYPLLAFQFVSVLSAALVSVFVYRIVARLHGQRAGAVAGIATALATPVGYWATIPKRHGLVALYALVTVYCFYRSREASSSRTATRFRALAYVPVGLTTWVFALEGFVLFVALGLVDVLTARSNRHRQLAFVGAVFLLSMLPFLVTNTLLSGNPLEPPWALPSYVGRTTALADPGNLTTGAGPASGATAPGPAPHEGLVSTVVEKLGIFVGALAGGGRAALDPGRLSGVFVRGGGGLGFRRFGSQRVNLSVLESMPLAAVLLSTPLVLYRRVRDSEPGRGTRLLTLRDDAERATDLLVGVYLVLLLLVYLRRLPMHSQFTVRYLHPSYPLFAYFLLRLELIREVVRSEGKLLAGSYAGLVLVGGPLLAFALGVHAGDVSEAVQLHARLSLAAAAVLLYWALVSVVLDGYERGGAVALGFAGAVTTLYLLFSGWVYFVHADRYALPVSRLVVESLVLW
jgi:4-amino-4-deoxy-L-arabinose transferase-like glycosyltransferase